MRPTAQSASRCGSAVKDTLRPTPLLNVVKRWLLPHDIRQQIKRSLFAHQDMHTRLTNLRRAGFAPSGAVDGGAYRGEWTAALWSVWPGCPSVMIEPLSDHRPILRAVAARTAGSRVISAAIGRASGQVLFRTAETNSSIVPESADDCVVEIDCTTLDAVVEQASDISLNFLKLDLQGYELEALAGCGQHLNQFEVILLEMSLLRIGEGPIFADVHRFLEAAGYRLYDMLPQYYRPLDGALWQIDAFYVREESSLISSRRWE